MKNIIKKMFLGICMVAICLLVAFATYGVIVAYIESFKAIGIIAILSFVYATFCLAMLLYTYYIIGDTIIDIRKKNMKKKENNHIKE